MSSRFAGWALDQKTGSPGSKLMLFTLGDNSFGDGSNGVVAEIAHLADRCEVTEAEAERLLLYLERKRFIVPIDQPRWAAAEKVEGQFFAFNVNRSNGNGR